MKPKPGKPMQGLALSVIATVLFQSIAFAQASSPAVVENRKPTQSAVSGGSVVQPSVQLSPQETLDSLPESPSTVQSKLVRAQNSQRDPLPSTLTNNPQSDNAQSNRDPGPQATDSVQSEQPNSTAPVSQPAPQESGSPVPDMPPLTGAQAEPAPIEPAKSEPAKSDQLGASPQALTPRAPLGTAVAEPLQTTGVAASRPAGIAVAPAGQRRVRTILIRVGSLVGAGVAIGTTMALSQGSTSRPPGSH